MSPLVCSTTYEASLWKVLGRGAVQDNSILAGTSIFSREGPRVRISSFGQHCRLTQDTSLFWEPES